MTRNKGSKRSTGSRKASSPKQWEWDGTEPSNEAPVVESPDILDGDLLDEDRFEESRNLVANITTESPYDLFETINWCFLYLAGTNSKPNAI